MVEDRRDEVARSGNQAEERLRDAPMREQIVAIVVEALRAQGQPDLSVDSVRVDPGHRAAFIEMLQDCRPLPVVKSLIEDLRSGAF